MRTACIRLAAMVIVPRDVDALIEYTVLFAVLVLVNVKEPLFDAVLDAAMKKPELEIPTPFSYNITATLPEDAVPIVAE
jgi:hypothetical protein